MKKLVYQYDDVYESWVFTTEEEAQKQEDRYSAFSASTWGDFKKRLPKEDYEWIGPILAGNHLEREDYTEEEVEKLEEPPADAPFKQHSWHEWNEFPQFLIFYQEDHFPKAILEKYGEKQVTVHDGWYYQFEKEVLKELIKALKERGIECERRDDLVISAW